MSLFDAEFYDFNVHAHSLDSIAALASVAKRYGYVGIAIVNSTIPEIALSEDFAVYSGVEIICKPSKLRNEIRKHEGKVLIIKGSDEDTSRTAVETEGLDILLQPVKFNHVLAKAASDNAIVLGFNMGSIIHKRGGARVRELITMRTNLKYARKYNLRMMLTNNAYSVYDIRTPKEMAALASLFGMTAKEAVDAMSATPAWIIRRKSPEYIQKGIEII